MGDGREAQQEGDIHLNTADVHCCVAETNTALESNFHLVKK